MWKKKRHGTIQFLKKAVIQSWKEKNVKKKIYYDTPPNETNSEFENVKESLRDRRAWGPSTPSIFWDGLHQNITVIISEDYYEINIREKVESKKFKEHLYNSTLVANIVFSQYSRLHKYELFMNQSLIRVEGN